MSVERDEIPEQREQKHLSLEESATLDRSMIDYIQRASATGLYEIRGLGAKRRVPHFDDLVFLGASLSRYPLEGYREKCSTKTKKIPILLWRNSHIIFSSFTRF